jgi:hypothetical protein
MSDVIRCLDAAAAGDRGAAADLLPLVHDELRKLAAARMVAESPGHTLSERLRCSAGGEERLRGAVLPHLLPPAEQERISAEDAGDREIGACRTADLVVYLAKASAANPNDTELFPKVTALQAWF